jgi:hypothetical protein
MFLAQNASISQSKMLAGTWYYAQHRFSFPFPAFAEDFWCKRPLGKRKSYLFFSHNILELALSHVTQASAKSTQYSSGKESSKDFQTCELRLIVA